MSRRTLWKALSLVLVLLIVSLFFGFTYSFEGEKENGFLCLKETGKDTVEIAVMGVLKTHHHKGIGRCMFNEAKHIAVEYGYSFIQANKLDEVFYPDETGEDGETVYSYNGDTITYDEYTSKIDNLAGMISGRFVMSQYVFWRSEYWSDAVLNAQDYSISLDEASAILGYSPVTEANPEVTGTTEPDNSYYVNELAGWWVKFGGLGGPVNYVYSFGMNSMDKYIYNDDGTYTFDSSVPVTYETTANEGIIIYITDTDTYYILNDEGDLEFQWGDNGYSGSDSLGRVE